MSAQRLVGSVWVTLVLVVYSVAGCKSETLPMKSPVDGTREVVGLLQNAPFWFDLAMSPADGSIGAETERGLKQLASCYAAIATYSTETIRAAEHAYMSGATGDQKVLMNRNLNVLNRYLFHVAYPASYPVDPRSKLIILPASPFVNSLETDALEEFDSFAKEYRRRDVTAGNK